MAMAALFAAMAAAMAVTVIGFGTWDHLPSQLSWASVETVAPFLSVLSLMLYGARRSRPDAVLLLSYPVWVTIAALNIALVRLNGPFA